MVAAAAAAASLCRHCLCACVVGGGSVGGLCGLLWWLWWLHLIRQASKPGYLAGAQK